MPAEGTAVLENLAFDLAREASELSAQLHPVVRLSVADLVRSMNCYYSNLISLLESELRQLHIRWVTKAKSSGSDANIAGGSADARATWNAICLADFGDDGVVFVAVPQIPLRNLT